MYADLGSAGNGDLLSSRTKLANGVGNHLDVGGRSAAATAHKFCAGLNYSPRVFRHVLGGTHVNLSATDVARQTGVWLCGKLATGQSAHLFDCVKHDRRSDSAVETNHVGAPFVQLRGK